VQLPDRGIIVLEPKNETVDADEFKVSVRCDDFNGYTGEGAITVTSMNQLHVEINFFAKNKKKAETIKKTFRR
jgi:hypothetical protein